MQGESDRPIASDHAAVFERSRPRLLGLAYRLLGSRADAEDAVQDTFVKWQEADRSAIRVPAAWLSATCTRHCLDLLRSAHRSRVDYIGTWLPEPVNSGAVEGDASVAEMGTSLTTAFLLLLERLTPKERAAYLLHEIFDTGYPEVAQALEIREPACRKLVERARQHVQGAKLRHLTPPPQQARLLSAFETAVREGRTDALSRLLADDVRLAADGGGKLPAVRRVIIGSDPVLRFVVRGLHRWWGAFSLERAILNGNLGLILRDGENRVVGTTSFSYDEAGRLDGIYIMRNPEKLTLVDAAAWPLR